ncbi:MAG: YbjN domain-containing protein [Lentisphaerae bacterium]|nr:YbjN domain-containing protein [Lentisphaerota bacterium]
MSKKTIRSNAPIPDQATGCLLQTVKTLSLPGKAVKIMECDQKGIVKFSAPLSLLGLNEDQVAALKAQKIGFLADVVGEALVRGNMDRFAILMENKKDYARFCDKFAHKHFVTLADDRKACFRFHVSLLHRIYNEELNKAISDSAALSGDQEDGYICSGIKSAADAGNEESGAPYDVLLQFFKEKEWNYHESRASDKDHKIIESGVTGRNGRYPFRVMLLLRSERILVQSFLPVAAPEEKRPAIAEYITRVNYRTVIGCFEMDYNDGEVNYKTSLDFENDRLSVALIRQLARSNMAIFDKYWPGFFKVIYADAAPAAAIKEIDDRK